MTDRLQAELAEAKAELQRVRKRASVGTTTVHNDPSLISLTPKWSGAGKGNPLEEFLSVIESSARIGLWEDEVNYKSQPFGLLTWPGSSITGVRNYIRQVQLGKNSRMCLDAGFATPIQISTTL